MNMLVPITDVCDFEGGTQPPKSQWSKYPEEGFIRMLQIRDFTQPKLKYIEYVKNDGKLRTCIEEDILIGRYGASIGKILTGLAGAYNVAIVKTKPDLLKLDRKYLKYNLKSRFFQTFITNVGSRAAQAGFNKSELVKFKIPLPSLETQQKIAAILDKADELVQNDKKILEKYDQLARSVFLEMFGDPAYTETKWQQMTLPEFIDKGRYSIKRGPFGGSLKKEIFVTEGYLIYEQYHAINDDFSMARYFISQEKFNELSAFRVYPGDLIISCSGVTLGRIAELPEDAIPGIINQALLKITLDRSIMNTTYFKFLFRNDRIQDVLFGVSRGSGIPNFPPMTTIKSIKFPVPPIELQNRFAEIINHIETQKQMAWQSLQKSEELFLSLLQGVLRGIV